MRTYLAEDGDVSGLAVLASAVREERTLKGRDPIALLVKSPDVRVFRVLSDIARTADAPGVRCRATRALLHWEDKEEGTQVLAKIMLNDSDRMVKIEAANAIGFLGDERGAKWFNLLADSDDEELLPGAPFI